MAPEVRVPLFSFSTAQQENTKKAVSHFLKETIQDRGQLLWIVTKGYWHWMHMARESFKGFLVDDEALHDIFYFLKEQAGPDPGKQLDALLNGNMVGVKLDKLLKIASAFSTVRELDAWLEGKLLTDPFQKAAIRDQLVRLVQANATATPRRVQ